MRTVNGLSARIYATDGAPPMVLHGAVLAGKAMVVDGQEIGGSEWRPQQWTREGHAFTGGASELDLTPESLAPKPELKPYPVNIRSVI